MKASGNKPIKKNKTPLVIMLYVNPLKIAKSMCPESILAANLRPSEMFLAKYEINSIKTKRGNKPKGHPAGTNKEKNCKPCFLKPNKVAPKTTVKLMENVKIKCEVEAKLYGIIPIKLFTKINMNSAYIKGKYTCPLFAFI